MLVYQYDKTGQLFCHQVIRSGRGDEVSSFKKKIEKIPPSHREAVSSLLLKNNIAKIAVFGNTAMNGNGVMEDCYKYNSSF